MDLVTMIMVCSLYRDNSIVNAMVQVGSRNNPLQVTTVREEGANTTVVTNPAAGAAYVNKELLSGHDVAIGLMQIPSGWLERYKDQVSLSELFRPCKNMAIATTILNHATEVCAKRLNRDPRCALAIYKTGSDSAEGQAYADKVLAYAQAHKIAPTPRFEDEPQEEVPVTPKEIQLPEPQFGSIDVE